MSIRRGEGAADVAGRKDVADVSSGGKRGARQFLPSAVRLAFLHARIVVTAHDTAEEKLEAADRKRLLADFAEGIEELVSSSHVDDKVDRRVDNEEEIVEFPCKLLR